MTLFEALALERRPTRPIVVSLPDTDKDVELPGPPVLEDLEDLPPAYRVRRPAPHLVVGAAWVSLACVVVLAILVLP